MTKAEDESERLKTEMSSFLLQNAEGLEKFMRTAEGQIRVLSVSARQRLELKEELKQLGRYDSEMVAILDARAPSQKSAANAEAAN